YSNNTTGSFNQWFHRDIDMNIVREFQDYTNEYGQQATWNHGLPTGYDPANPQYSFYAPYYWYNPYSWQKGISNEFNRNRVFGDASLTYKATNDLSLRFTYRRNQLNTDYDTRQYNVLAITNAGRNSSGFNYWETVAGRSAMWQGFAFGDNQSIRQNYEVLATYNKKIKDFSIGGYAGLNIAKNNQQTLDWSSLGGLTVADEFLVANSKQQNPISRNITRSGNRSVFAKGDFGYKNLAFLDATYRRDYYSSQSKDNPINTFSVGASLIVSDLMGLAADAPLHYIKVRGSYGQISSALNPYQNSVLYNPTTTYPVNYNGTVRMATIPDRLVDPGLMGTNNAEKEIGLELRFFKNRLTFNGTYWDRTNKDFPFDVTVYPGSGSSVLSTNTGKITKKGLEFQASIVPVRT
ncbi:MAG: TonB-dependent receptor, partial [Pedobacter sp.]